MTITSATTMHFVSDMDRALGFYKGALGLESTSESPYWSTLAVTPGCELALHIGEPPPPDRKPFPAHGTVLNLLVDDLDAYLERIERAGGAVVGIQEAGGGIPLRQGRVVDSEGNGFQVNQYVPDG